MFAHFKGHCQWLYHQKKIGSHSFLIFFLILLIKSDLKQNQKSAKLSLYLSFLEKAFSG